MRKGLVYSLVLYLSCASGLLGQTFQNLDFESANVSNLPPDYEEFVSVSDGLPGWSAYIGTKQLTQVGHNAITLGDANVGIMGPQYSFGYQPLEGTYTAILQAGGTQNEGAQPASIAQTGLIPVWANSLQFEARLFYTNDLTVTVGSQNTTVFPLGSGFFGCDISSFAGSVEEMRFTIGAAHGSAPCDLDAISFSAQPIPEPSGLSLLVIGVVALGCWRVTYRKTA
jgi:hypothetical protein